MTTKILNTNSAIAAYLRKSREDKDTEDTLRKHREALEEYVARQGFNNVEWFEEVGSGETIEGRPVFASLLPRIEACEFDAVLVVHIDRLSRGSQAEAGYIIETFQESKTVLLTLEKNYDFENESDLMLSEFQGAISRGELRAIKRRLREGKKKAVQDGRPHSGNPPFGYYWDRNTKSCLVDVNQSKIYRMVIDWFLNEGLSAGMIAERLNESKVPTSSGRGNWHGESITELLRHDFHLGFVVYGRYKSIKNAKGNLVPIKNPDPSQTIVARGNHQTLKSQEEHAAIIQRIETLRTYSMKDRRIRKDTYRLSGLIYCPHCGKCQGVGKPKGRHEHLRKCLKKTTARTAACNMTKGIAEDIIFQAVIHQMKLYHEDLFAPNDEHQDQTEANVKDLIAFQEQAVEKANRRISNAKEMRLDGDIDKTEFKAIKDKQDSIIREAETKIAEMKAAFGLLKEAEKNSRKERWKSSEVSRMLSGEEIDPSEANRILRQLILRINYIVTEGNEVEVKIRYK